MSVDSSRSQVGNKLTRDNAERLLGLKENPASKKVFQNNEGPSQVVQPNLSKMNVKKTKNSDGTLKKKKKNIGKAAESDEESSPSILRRRRSRIKENKVFIREPTHFRSISPSFFSKLANNCKPAPSSKQVSFSGLKDPKNRDEKDIKDSEDNFQKKLMGEQNSTDHTGLIDIDGSKKPARRKKSRSMSVHEARQVLSLSHTPFLKVISLDEPVKSQEDKSVQEQPPVATIPQPPYGSINQIANNKIGVESEVINGNSPSSMVYRRRTYSTCGSCVK